eukprot:5257379-Pleurochrysis_carterae.AAC.1
MYQRSDSYFRPTGSSGTRISPSCDRLSAEWSPWAETVVVCHDIKAKGEDRFATKRVDIDGQRIVFCLVADGHNDGDAAHYCKLNVINFIIDACHGDATANKIQDACVIAFHKVHEHIRTQSAFPTSGLTLAVVA